MEPVVPILDEGLGNAAYLVDLGDGRALVVDPARHPGKYVCAAERRKLEIAFALETHLHADFVSGSRELAALGAVVLVPAGGGHAFPARGLHDGEAVHLGGLVLEALATPGHTPEHLAYLLRDGPRPLALFSGGSLLAGAVARTDLVAPDRTVELARALWRSLRERVLTLPDDVVVYPTHGAGSFCSTNGGGDRTTTIGRERRANPLLGAGDEETFVERLLAGFGSYPPYFLRLRELNRTGPRLHGPGEAALPALRPGDVRRLQASGALVVDVRPVAAFGRSHVPGSVSIALRPQLGSWLGWVAPEDAALVFVLDAGQDESEVVRQARNVGYETLLGRLDGGMDAWTAAGLPVASVPVVPVHAAEGTVVDVRQRHEFEAGHVPGAVGVEAGAITSAELPPGPLAVMCGHGERAMTAASLLVRAGRGGITVLDGGPGDWALRHGAPAGGGAG